MPIVGMKQMGMGKAMISNRTSWFFDMKGPSIGLDTACSPSLVALHLAVQSIRSGETPQVRNHMPSTRREQQLTICTTGSGRSDKSDSDARDVK